MSRFDKSVERIRRLPKDFTFDELTSLLSGFGYELSPLGKTSGSRVRFVNSEGKKIILHKPHPKGILKIYQLKQIIEHLEL